jgi:hypothetical protein
MVMPLVPAGVVDPRTRALGEIAAATVSPNLQTSVERQILAPEANPFALSWVPAGSFDPFTTNKIGQTRPVTGQNNVVHVGDGSLHPGDQPNVPATAGLHTRGSWHQIVMEPIGEVFFDVPPDEVFPGSNPPDADTGLSIGNTATILKARATLMMGNARKQKIDFDILAGVDFSLACFHVIDIQALVPDPTSVPTSVPPDLTFRSIATVISTAIYCGLPPRGSRQTLTYSQLFFLGMENVAEMPVVPAAKEVEVFVDQPAVAANSVVIEFLYAEENPLFARSTNVMLTDVIPLGSTNVPIGSFNSPRVTIPGQTNLIRVTQSGLTNLTVNIVQLLKI